MASSRIQINKAGGIGVVGKLFATLFLGAFLAGGLFFAWLLLGELFKTIDTYSWTETDCQILASGVEQDGKNSESPYLFTVRYQYTFQGNPHTSSQTALSKQSFGDYQKAQALADRFSAGSSATCLVNPDQPDQAVLVKGHLWIAFFLVIPLVFILIGGGGIFVVWTAKIAPASSSPASKAVGREVRPSITQKAKGLGGRRVQFGLFLAFLIIGTVLTGVFFVRPLLKVQKAKSWIETHCVVESSHVRSHSSDDGTTYSVDILYRYTFNGREFKSNRYKFMGGSSSGRSGKNAIVRQYPKGKETVCFVNPANPSEAVLQRGFTWDMLIGLIPAIFALVGLVGLIHHGRTAPGRQARRPAHGHAALRAPGKKQPLPDAGSRPLVLKQKTSALTKLVGIILFAVFWNGIVSVFVWQVFKAWQSSRGGFMEKWFLPIFLIPFVLVGLGLIFGIFYYFLALFNPKPRLRLGSGRVGLGDETVVQWNVRGRLHALQRLHIFLEGREEARYRRGTRTRTDTHVFRTIDIANLTSHNSMRSGQAPLVVPQDTMHSFSASNNKIIWTLKVKGEIKIWPDVDEEFPIEIQSRSAAASSRHAA